MKKKMVMHYVVTDKPGKKELAVEMMQGILTVPFSCCRLGRMSVT